MNAHFTEAALEDTFFNFLVQNQGYDAGHSAGFDRDLGIDRVFLLKWLENTQKVELENWKAEGGADWNLKLMKQLTDSIHKNGVVKILLGGFKCGACRFDLFYPRPVAASTPQQIARWKSNLFSATRQLHFSAVAASDSLDMAVFLNGLPVATFELKNAFTGQNVGHAIRQYREDRDAKEALFKFGHCLVHMAVDADEVWMTTKIAGEKTVFLPFNRGTKSGGGNPVNPAGLRVAYLWEELLAPESLAEIIEKFAALVKEPGDDGLTRDKLVFPRFHQRDCVQKLLADVRSRGAGHKYLVQHSAGSGKSNTIAWLCHNLIEQKRDGDPTGKAIFDSVIVVTDLRVLDKQIGDTIKRFAPDPRLIETVTQGSRQLKDALQAGKKIIVTTIQKFPFILDEIGALPQTNFAIVIDEAHSSQGGRIAGEMNLALSGGKNTDGSGEQEEEFEDKLNKLIEGRKMLGNASYFAFTATPKPKTLELFGEKQPDGKFRAIHEYSMKQAIAEGFILDVLQNYTTYQTFYTLFKTVEEDPQFDTSRAAKKLRAMVEKSPAAIAKKAAIMIEHFKAETSRRMNNSAKAMVVTSGIVNAIRYKQAFDHYIAQNNLPFQSIVAFTGTKEVDGLDFSEDGMNGFESSKIPQKFKAPEMKFLIVADKFQTGFDEPLLHTMYVDKPLGDLQAVQTLSRLNRSHPLKNETFILDFVNKPDVIKAAFNKFYEGTILSEETDINRLNGLQDDIEAARIFDPDEAAAWVKRFLGGEKRETLESSLDFFVEIYRQQLSEDEKIKFKGDLKSYLRAYEFLSAVRPFKRHDWEVLSIFGRFLLPKLPAPLDDDLSKGVLEATGLQSYRVVRRDVQLKIELEAEPEVEPAQIPGGSIGREPEIDKLSSIIKAFNDRYGKDTTPSQEKFIVQEAPVAIAADPDYQAAKKHSDRENARDIYGQKFRLELQKRMRSETELFKRLNQNPEVLQWLIENLFDADYSGGNLGA